MNESFFAAMRMPFPLFEAPDGEIMRRWKEAERGRCDLCREPSPLLFGVNLLGDDEKQGRFHGWSYPLPANLSWQEQRQNEMASDALMTRCARCEKLGAFHYQDGLPQECWNCRESVEHPYPSVGSGHLSACYRCLRGGRVALTTETIHGTISSHSLRDGFTSFARQASGVVHEPLQQVRCADPNDDELRVALPRADISELLRTPKYRCIQWPLWMFHCGAAMVYVGEVTAERPELLLALHPHLTPADLESPAREASGGAVDHALGLGIFSEYAFRCRVCGNYSSDSRCG